MATLLLLGSAGCASFDRADSREGRVLLQVRDEASGAALEGVDVRVEGLNGPVARGTTNGAGNVGLTFRAPTVMLTSLPKVGFYWIVLRIEAAGYAALDVPCGRHDFVETSGIRVLTRGVALRRAS